MARHAGQVYSKAPEKTEDPAVGNLLRQLHADEGSENARVLVGFCKSTAHKNWIENNHKYNIRYGEKYPVNADMLAARYLLLYRDADFEHASIWEIKAASGVLKMKEEMLASVYPDPGQKMYLVFELGNELSLGMAYRFPESGAENFQPLHNHLRNDRLPFSLSLAELASLREVVA